MRILTSGLILLLLSSCAAKKSQLDFLVGTWKRENKDHFEVWEKGDSLAFMGYFYKLSNNQKNITESLAIRKIGDQYVYEATVPDQNEGRTIQFKLNKENDSLFSFENNNHDFPKKIQYLKISDTRLKVFVLGDNGSGFSYIQIKQ